MLSIQKLEKLLALKGYTVKNFFVISDVCAYIEAISIEDASTFLLYIPSKYEFKIRSNEKNIHKIKFIEIGDDDEIDDSTVEHYASQPDNLRLEQTYTEIETIVGHDFQDFDRGDNDMATHLEEAYKRPIKLKDINKDDIHNIRDICRQLRRLKYCVQNIKYKVSIIYKNYLCVLNRHEELECYLIKHYSKDEYRRLLVLVNLEIFYEKMDKINIDIEKVREGIFKVLDKNQSMHTRNLYRMLEEKNDVVEVSNNVINNKTIYSTHISKFKSMLETLTKKENELFEDLDGLNSKRGEYVHNDATLSHQKSKIEKELDHIDVVKRKVMKHIVGLNSKIENINLSTDKIFFDNTVMMNEIFKNFAELKKITI